MGDGRVKERRAAVRHLMFEPLPFSPTLLPLPPLIDYILEEKSSRRGLGPSRTFTRFPLRPAAGEKECPLQAMSSPLGAGFGAAPRYNISQYPSHSLASLTPASLTPSPHRRWVGTHTGAKGARRRRRRGPLQAKSPRQGGGVGAAPRGLFLW